MASVPIDTSEANVTPVFKYVDLENVPQSEQMGFEVRQPLEIVEIHTAGSRNALPVFRANDVWKREGNRSITYAERFNEQYLAFKAGASQKASGTPLEVLRQHGVSPELQSICRAHKIYSVEALHNLSTDGIRALGIHANKLRDAARAHMAQSVGAVALIAETEALKARIAELEAAREAPVAEPDDGIAAMTDSEIKDKIALANDGRRPPGNPSRATLEAALREVRQAAAQPAS